jgi:two-component SAPR family response regulator
LAFLDIQMPELSGAQLAKLLPNHIQVIFTTGYSEYAMESLNLEATDYLLKPITFERFYQAVQKVKK